MIKKETNKNEKNCRFCKTLTRFKLKKIFQNQIFQGKN